MILRIVLVLLIAGTACAEIQVRDGLVSADIQSQPLSQVLDRLKSQINMRLVIDEGIAGKTVSASFRNLPVGPALKKLLEGTGINFAVLAGADGQPQSVFIGGSARPGAPPRRLDNRPVGTRGVVSPVAPSPAPPPPTTIPQPEALQQQPLPEKPLTPAVNVPTGGGFVPEQPNVQTPAGQQQQQDDQQQEQPDNEDED
jgi:hypothetical protein